MVRVGVQSRAAIGTGLVRVAAAGFAEQSAEPAIEVVLRSGHTLLAAAPTRILAAGVRQPAYRRLDELQTGDYIAVQLGTMTERGLTPAMIDWDGRLRRLDPQLALALGVLTARGSRGGKLVKLFIADQHLRKTLADLLNEVMLPTRQYNTADRGERELLMLSQPLQQWLSDLGVLVPSPQRHIPDAVLHAPLPTLLSYLQGLSLHYVFTYDQGKPTGLKLDAASPTLTADIHAAFTRVGILSSYDIDSKRNVHRIRVVGIHAQKLVRLAPPLEPGHAAVAEDLLGTPVNQARRSLDVVPFADGRRLWQLLPDSSPKRGGPPRQYNHLLDPRTRAISRTTVQNLAEILGPDLPSPLRRVLDDRLHFFPITRIKHQRSRLTPFPSKNHPLWIDGFLLHG